MKIYKLFYHLLMARKLNFIVGIVLFFAIIFPVRAAYMNAIHQEFTPPEATIGIVNYDHDDPVTQNLLTYLDSKSILISLPPESEVIADQLFTGNVNYVLTIPEGYGQDLLTSAVNQTTNTVNLNKTESNSLSVGAYIDNYLYTFWMNFRISAQQLNDVNDTAQVYAMLTDLTELLQQEVTIIPGDRVGNVDLLIYSQLYTPYMAYIMIMVLINIFSFPLLSIRNKEVAMRETMSGMTQKQRIVEFFLGCVSISLIYWIIFIAGAFFIHGSEIFSTQQGILVTLSSFISLFGIQGLCFFVATVVPNQGLASFLQIGLSLLIAFGSGIFVPIDFVSPTMQTLVSLASPIWQLRANRVITSAARLDSEMLQQIAFYFVIQILIGLAYYSLSFLVFRYRSLNKSY